MKSRTWHLPDIGCLLSIGAGASSPARIDTFLNSTSLLRIAGIENLQRAQELLRAIFQSSTDCERTHEELFRHVRLADLNYSHFNVESGFEDVGRYEASKVATLCTGTDGYLQKPDMGNTLSTCALHLLKGYVIQLLQALAVANGPSPADELQPTYDVISAPDEFATLVAPI